MVFVAFKNECFTTIVRTRRICTTECALCNYGKGRSLRGNDRGPIFYAPSEIQFFSKTVRTWRVCTTNWPSPTYNMGRTWSGRNEAQFFQASFKNNFFQDRATPPHMHNRVGVVRLWNGEVLAREQSRTDFLCAFQNSSFSSTVRTWRRCFGVDGRMVQSNLFDLQSHQSKKVVSAALTRRIRFWTRRASALFTLDPKL